MSGLFKDEKWEREKELALCTAVLSCLHKCFLYDTSRFVNSQRFNTLMQPIIDQVRLLLVSLHWPQLLVSCIPHSKASVCCLLIFSCLAHMTQCFEVVSYIIKCIINSCVDVKFFDLSINWFLLGDDIWVGLQLKFWWKSSHISIWSRVIRSPCRFSPACLPNNVIN